MVGRFWAVAPVPFVKTPHTCPERSPGTFAVPCVFDNGTTGVYSTPPHGPIQAIDRFFWLASKVTVTVVNLWVPVTGVLMILRGGMVLYGRGFGQELGTT